VTDAEALALVAAVMRAAGVSEVRIPAESLVNPPPVHVVTYADAMCDYRVIRLVELPDVPAIGAPA
jgi:hypothetical protein